MGKGKGLLVALAAPSGTGKGTIIANYLTRHKETLLSISCTSRTQRPGDPDGSYFFITREKFEEMIKNNDFFEWVDYCGNYYGTPKSFIMEKIKENRDVLLEIDYIGALSVKKAFPSAVLVFVLPPDYQELKHRLEKRCSDSPQKIIERLKRAKEEVENATKFDYLIINDDLEKVTKNLEEIINYEKTKNKDNIKIIEKLTIDNPNNEKFIQDFGEQIKNNQQ